MTHLVALKLTDTELTALDQLVQLGYYKTRSAALRAGLMGLPEMEKLKLESLVQIRIERCGHPMRRAKGFRDQLAGE